jgi:hypothetical protein
MVALGRSGSASRAKSRLAEAEHSFVLYRCWARIFAATAVRYIFLDNAMKSMVTYVK